MAENEAHESIKPFHVFSTDQESASVNSYQNNSDKKKKKWTNFGETRVEHHEFQFFLRNFRNNF